MIYLNWVKSRQKLAEAYRRNVKKQSVQEQSVTNHALLNVITPVRLEFTKNSLSVGENIGKIYGLILFKQINDRYGHFAGDLVFKDVVSIF